jgi:hypothetical protein
MIFSEVPGTRCHAIANQRCCKLLIFGTNMGERPIEPRASLAGLCQNLAAMEFSNPREQKLGGALRVLGRALLHGGLSTTPD